MSDGEIFINHAHVNTFIEDMGGANQQIRDIVTQLETEMRQIVVNWEGPDQEYYTTAIQPRWEAEVAQLGQILHGHAEILNDVSQNYQKTVNTTVQDLQNVSFG